MSTSQRAFFGCNLRITGFKNGRRYDIVRPKYSEMSTHADYKSMKPYIDIAEKAKTDAMDAMEKALKG